MKKTLDLKKSVYELIQEYPEVVQILSSVGFSEVENKVAQHTVAKVMTIPQGAAIKHIALGHVIRAFRKAGFAIEGREEVGFAGPEVAKNREERKAELKKMLLQLHDGIPLEQVRQAFIRSFSHVEAAEIMAAEQELIQEGTPIEEVQKLCDLHSALFHDAAGQRVQNPEEVEQMLRNAYEETGHPLRTFKRENDVLRQAIVAVKEDLEKGTDAGDSLGKMSDLAIHYAKKGDLLYPLLAQKYGVTGPSKVMWTVDDEIRRDVRLLQRREFHEEIWREEVKTLVQRAEEMIYKEEHILFPICVRTFTQADWVQIYKDGEEYDPAFSLPAEVWAAATAGKAAVLPEGWEDGKIVMPGGSFTVRQLTAVLNTMPVEITFVDEEDVNRFFNEGPKVFKRPMAAIGRDVYSCHPPKIEAMVRMIISEFKAGRRDKVERWAERKGKPLFVTYFAVRDRDGKYLGTLETVQDMQFAKDHFAGRA